MRTAKSRLDDENENSVQNRVMNQFILIKLVDFIRIQASLPLIVCLKSHED